MVNQTFTCVIILFIVKYCTYIHVYSLFLTCDNLMWSVLCCYVYAMIKKNINFTPNTRLQDLFCENIT